MMIAKWPQRRVRPVDIASWIAKFLPQSASSRRIGLTPWQEDNLTAIEARLQMAKAAKQGLIFAQNRNGYSIILVKKKAQIQMYFATVNDKQAYKITGIMSRIDVNNPLRLLGRYTQVMMLSLIWKPRPQRVCVLGFGGGRIPMILHHFLPEVDIDATEVDEIVAMLSEKYFGIAPDDRLRLYVQDGRSFLEERDVIDGYDIIIVDCFSGLGVQPHKFATREFYDLCRARLATDGVLISNIDRSDDLLAKKEATFAASFSHTWRFRDSVANVLVGSDVRLDKPEILRRVDELRRAHSFSFNLSKLAGFLRPLGNARARRSAKILSDKSMNPN